MRCTFDHVAELRWGNRHSALRRRRPDEAPTLQPLREQARAMPIVPDHFDEVAQPNDIQHTDRRLW